MGGAGGPAATAGGGSEAAAAAASAGPAAASTAVASWAGAEVPAADAAGWLASALSEARCIIVSSSKRCIAHHACEVLGLWASASAGHRQELFVVEQQGGEQSVAKYSLLLFKLGLIQLIY